MSTEHREIVDLAYYHEEAVKEVAEILPIDGDATWRTMSWPVPQPLGQHEFAPRFQHGEPADFLEVPGETGFSREDRRGRVAL